jgi:hypothetical protein
MTSLDLLVVEQLFITAVTRKQLALYTKITSLIASFDDAVKCYHYEVL